MSYRARPVVRQRRAPWDRPDRRNLLTNIGFGLVIVIAVVVLAAAAGLAWYDQHLAPVAAVNGQGITKDEFNRRLEVERARLAIAESRISDEFNAGRIDEQQRENQLQFIEQRRQQLPAIALERLIDARIEADLASQEGVAVGDADLEAQVTEEATRPEQRFVSVIEVVPEIAADAEEPTEAAKAAAKQKAEAALAELRAGKAWEEVAASVSSDPDAPASSELGWVTSGFDANEAFDDAVFALESGAFTEVFEDEDGTYRIGRVTDIAPSTVDPDYRALIADRGASVEAYEAAVRQDVVRDKLRERIEGLALGEAPQRRVAEIFLENDALPEAPPEGAVKARHILYSPKDDPQGAGVLPAEDPAWKEAEDAARKAYETIRADPTKFDQLARSESDEGAAEISGGKLPWFDPAQVEAGALDPDFGAAIFQPGLQPLQILEPVKSAFGWHLIQVLYTIPDEEQANWLKGQLESGALSFADAARDYSYGAEAAEGGEIGWIARFQLDQQSEEAVFAAPVGSIAGPVAIDGDGVHLYLVHEEQTRAPDGEQRQSLEQSAFTNWFAAKKAGYEVDRELAIGALG